MAIQMQQVESSNIDSIGYDPGPPQKMRIQFKGGGLYEYRAVDPSDTVTVKKHYDDMVLAESKGRHFTKHVRHDKKLITDRIS